MEPTPCPTWMYRRSPQDKCICGKPLQGAVVCRAGKYYNSISVVKNFCTVLSENMKTTVVLIGTCPYGGGLLPENKSELINFVALCSLWHRRGQLCGACDENYTLPVYSYYLGCVKCKDYKYGWLKFITVAFLPLTVFCILVIIF